LGFQHIAFDRWLRFDDPPVKGAREISNASREDPEQPKQRPAGGPYKKRIADKISN
jgi:hypothetical protein